MTTDAVAWPLAAEARSRWFGVDTLYVRPGLAACYLAVADGEAMLVDCGGKNAPAQIAAALAQIGAELTTIVVTHVHLDHSAAAGELLRRYPRATLRAHEAALPHLIDPNAKLVPAARALYGGAFFGEHYGEVVPVDAARARVLVDGESIWEKGEFAPRAIHTPGHAWHHLSVWDESTRVVITGDSFGISYPDFDVDGRELILPAMPPSQIDPPALRASLAKIAALQPRAVALTHFGERPFAPSLIDQQSQWLDKMLALGEKRLQTGASVASEADSIAESLRADFTAMIESELRARGASAEVVASARDKLRVDSRLNAAGVLYYLQKRARAAEAA